MTDEPEKPLSAADLDEAADFTVKAVHVPEWKGTIYLRTLPADEGLQMNDRMQALPKEKQTEGLFILVGACMGKADGSAFFDSPEQARKTLGRKSMAVLVRLQTLALELNGLSAPGKA